MSVSDQRLYRCVTRRKSQQNRAYRKYCAQRFILPDQHQSLRQRLVQKLTLLPAPSCSCLTHTGPRDWGEVPSNELQLLSLLSFGGSYFLLFNSPLVKFDPFFNPCVVFPSTTQLFLFFLGQNFKRIYFFNLFYVVFPQFCRFFQIFLSLFDVIVDFFQRFFCRLFSAIFLLIFSAISFFLCFCWFFFSRFWSFFQHFYHFSFNVLL